MLLRVTAVTAAIAAASLVLTGCSLLPVPQATTADPQPTDAQAVSSCPDIEAHDFAVELETTPADPVAMAESVGLGDLLEGTCAYGFETVGDGFDGVAFFIIDPSEDAATTFVDSAVQTAHDAGFFINHAAAVGQSETNSGPNEAGDSFLVAWFAEVNSGDGRLPDASMDAIGLDSGASVIIGSIQLAG